MVVKSLRDLCLEILFRVTLKNARVISKNEVVRLLIFDIWSYISLMPLHSAVLFYKLLNRYSHWLSHDCKMGSFDELQHFPTITADEVFNMLIICQSPKLIFDYRMKRQRMIPDNIVSIIDSKFLYKYFNSILTELDLSGADFCCDDELLVKLLPKCRSLQVLCLGNAGSDDVLSAAQFCPLRKLQLEERFPLHPKLPQDTVLKHLLGYVGCTEDLNRLLEICKLKSQALLEDTFQEENEETRREWICHLENFLSNCKPSWPNMKILIFGNCRICREALMLCLLVLKSLEEISIHRIQSDEILNTCDRVFKSFGLNYQLSIKRLILWAGWAGFRTNVLEIAPHANNLCLAFGYSDLSLQETVENNTTLKRINTLSLVGLRHAGTNIFNTGNCFLNGVENLDISGVILSTEELVNIFSCLQNLMKVQLDYSELRNHNYVLEENKCPKSKSLTNFSVETSFVDIDFLKALFVMAKNIENLCIKGKTRSFNLSLQHQNLFLLNPDLKVKYLELYPQYPLNIQGLVNLARTKTLQNHERLQLHIPLSSLTKYEMNILTYNGWNIIPACSRC